MVRDTFAQLFLEASKPELYRENAFRTLGIGGDSKPSEISKAVEKLVALEKLGTETNRPEIPFPFFPLPGQEKIREAERRLKEPENRAIEVFFWFWEPGPGHDEFSFFQALSRGDIYFVAKQWLAEEEKDTSGSTRHNLAVLFHLVALDLEFDSLVEPLPSSQAIRLALYWKEALTRWFALWKDDQFWTHVATRWGRNKEKFPAERIVPEIREALPTFLLNLNVQLGLLRFQRGEKEAGKRQLEIMKESGFDSAVAWNVVDRFLKPVLEQVSHLCAETNSHIMENVPGADTLLQSFLEKVQPLLSLTNSFLPFENEHSKNIHDQVAECVSQGALLFGKKTENWQKAGDILQQASIIISRDESKKGILEDLPVFRERQKNRREWHKDGYHQLPSPLLEFLEKNHAKFDGGKKDEALKDVADLFMGRTDIFFEENQRPFILKPLAHCLESRGLELFHAYVKCNEPEEKKRILLSGLEYFLLAMELDKSRQLPEKARSAAQIEGIPFPSTIPLQVELQLIPISELFFQLGNKNFQTRISALKGLEKIGSKDSSVGKKIANVVLTDENAEVQEIAEEILAKNFPELFTEFLPKRIEQSLLLLEEENEKKTRIAFRTFQKHGEAAKHAGEKLLPLILYGKDRNIALEAEETLKKIDPGLFRILYRKKLDVKFRKGVFVVALLFTLLVSYFYVQFAIGKDLFAASLFYRLGLANKNDIFKIIFSQIKKENPTDRLHELELLENFNLDRPIIIPIFVEALTDSDDRISDFARAFLERKFPGWQKTDEVKALIPKVGKTLDSPNETVFLKGLQVIGEIAVKPEVVQPYLIASLRNKKLAIQKQVLVVLEKTNPDWPDSLEGRAFINETFAALKTQSSSGKIDSLELLARIGPKAKIDLSSFGDILNEKDSKSRDTARDAAARINPKLQPVFQLISLKQEEGVDGVVLKLLEKIDSTSTDTVPFLLDAIKTGTGNYFLQKNSMKALGKIGSEAYLAFPLLIQALDSEDDQVYACAKEALDAIEPNWRNIQKDPFLKAFKRRGIRMQRRILEILGELPVADEGIIQMMREALKDSDPSVVLSAKKAWGKLDRDLEPLLEILFFKNETWDDQGLVQSTFARINPDSDKTLKIFVENLSQKDFYSNSMKALVKIGSATQPVIRSITEKMKTENENVRTCLVKGLGELGPMAQESIPVLINALSDASMTTSIVIEALGKIQPDWIKSEAGIKWTTRMTADLQDKDDVIRKNAFRELVEIGPLAKPFLPFLIKSLTDPVPEIREKAAAGLGEIGPEAKRAIPSLIKALGDPQWFVTGTVLKTLGKLKQDAKPAIPAMENIYLKGELVLSLRAEESLRLVDPKWEPPVETAESEGDGTASGSSTAQGKPAESEFDPKKIPEYIASLSVKDPSVRRNAAITLGTFGSTAKSSIPKLIGLLSDADDQVRLAAAETLGKMGVAAEKAIPQLCALFVDPNPDVRKTAIHSLGKMGSQAVPTLIQALQYNDPILQENVLIALAKIGQGAKSAVPILIETLKSPSGTMRRHAAIALGKIGPASKPALSLLRTLKTDRDQAVKDAVIQAIISIEK